MNVILLSGGSGKRLWPLSNNVRSKQFIKIFKNSNGEYESMLQRMYKGIKDADPAAKITIATSKSQISSIINQLGDNVQISKEPCRRDTFPAIALAAAFLHDVGNVKETEPVVICPVDPYVDSSYFKALSKLSDLAEENKANLTLLGMEPTYPSEKYGYIIPQNKNDVSKVECFKEKPDLNTAKEYISRGALWNGGIFAFKLGYLLQKCHDLIDFSDYSDLFNKYETLEKISFDYAVVEKEPNIQVLRFNGSWKDLGTWNTLTEAMDENVQGNAILDTTCKNVHVVNELDAPVICMGLENVVISASVQGILVADKNQSSYMKPLVDSLKESVRFAEKSWGEYKVIDSTGESLTVKVTLRAGHKMNYHAHQNRSEIWNIVSGEGKVILDGAEQNVSAGDIVKIPVLCKHTIIAKSDLQILEVQLGKEISASDKIKYELN